MLQALFQVLGIWPKIKTDQVPVLADLRLKWRKQKKKEMRPSEKCPPVKGCNTRFCDGIQGVLLGVRSPAKARIMRVNVKSHCTPL